MRVERADGRVRVHAGDALARLSVDAGGLTAVVIAAMLAASARLPWTTSLGILAAVGAVTAVLRSGVGARVTVRPEGVDLVRTCLGVPWSRLALPREVRVEVRGQGDWGDPDDLVGSLCELEPPRGSPHAIGTDAEAEGLRRAIRDALAAIPGRTGPGRDHRRRSAARRLGHRLAATLPFTRPRVRRVGDAVRVTGWQPGARLALGTMPLGVLGIVLRIAPWAVAVAFLAAGAWDVVAGALAVGLVGLFGDRFRVERRGERVAAAVTFLGVPIRRLDPVGEVCWSPDWDWPDGAWVAFEPPDPGRAVGRPPSVEALLGTLRLGSPWSARAIAEALELPGSG